MFDELVAAAAGACGAGGVGGYVRLAGHRARRERRVGRRRIGLAAAATRSALSTVTPAAQCCT